MYLFIIKKYLLQFLAQKNYPYVYKLARDGLSLDDSNEFFNYCLLLSLIKQNDFLQAKKEFCLTGARLRKEHYSEISSLLRAG